MVNVSIVGNNPKVYDNLNLSNPIVGNYNFSPDALGAISLFSDRDVTLNNLNNFGSGFMADLALFDMYLNNQMPLMLQQQLFMMNYNTRTDLKELKDVYNPSLANKLANIAARNAYSKNTVGWCARGTNEALEMAGLANGETRVASAWQAAYKLRNHKNFKEVRVSREDLKNLPAGCIVVWQASWGNPHGHIAVTLGDGREASDHVQYINTNRQASYSVFIPVGNKKTSLSA